MNSIAQRRPKILNASINEQVSEQYCAIGISMRLQKHLSVDRIFFVGEIPGDNGQKEMDICNN